MKYIIENDHDVIFNMELIIAGARPAFLIEATNRDKYDFTEVLDEIKRKYGKYGIGLRVENEINEIPHRVLITKLKTKLPKKRKNHDEWLAEALGFNCHGLPDKDKDRYVLLYKIQIDDEITNFYAEICPSLDRITSKLDKFQKVASKFGWKVHEKIELILSESTWETKIYNNDIEWLYKNMEDLILWLSGNGWEIFGDFEPVEILETYRPWLIFCAAISEIDPYSSYYPVTNKMDSDIQEIIEETFTLNDPLFTDRLIEKIFRDNGFIKNSDKGFLKKQRMLYSKYNGQRSLGAGAGAGVGAFQP